MSCIKKVLQISVVTMCLLFSGYALVGCSTDTKAVESDIEAVEVVKSPLEVAQENVNNTPSSADNWTVLIELKEAESIDHVALKTLYIEAAEATNSEIFIKWLESHQAEAVTFNLTQGEYTEDLNLTVEESYDILMYKCEALGQEAYTVYDGPIELKGEGEYHIQLLSTNSYELSTETSMVYVIEYPNELIMIEDPLLEVAIREALGQAEEPLYQKALRTVKVIDLDGTGITNINGIENCVNLETLWLDYSQVVDFTPISSLVHLKELTFNYAQVGSLSFLSTLKELEMLSMGEAQIDDLNGVENLVSLKKIEMSACGISDIEPLRNATNLEELGLSYNPISNIDALSGKTEIKIIIANDCDISDLTPLENASKMKALILFGNNVSDLSPLGGMTQLENLGLMDNQVSHIEPITELVNLKQVILYNNQLKDISGLSALKSVEKLMLGNNPITGICYFNEMSQLKELDLSSITSMVIQYSFFSDAPSLEKVTLSNSQCINDLDSNEFSFEVVK